MWVARIRAFPFGMVRAGPRVTVMIAVIQMAPPQVVRGGLQYPVEVPTVFSRRMEGHLATRFAAPRKETHAKGP